MTNDDDFDLNAALHEALNPQPKPPGVFVIPLGGGEEDDFDNWDVIVPHDPNGPECDCPSVLLHEWYTTEKGWYVGAAIIPLPPPLDEMVSGLNRRRAASEGIEKYRVRCPDCSRIYAENHRHVEGA